MVRVEIRWASFADCSGISAVHVKSYRAAYKGIIPDDYLDKIQIEERLDYYQRLLQFPNRKLVAASINDRIIGFAEVGKSSDQDLEDCLDIFAIYILPQHVGKGFGKQLVEWVLNNARELDCRHVALWVLEENKAAIKFYERLNFVFDGAQRTIERGKRLVQLRYRNILIR